MIQARGWRRPLGIDVLTAARERIAFALEHTERACVSFSGGKDSTVMLHLVMDEAIRRGRSVGVLFIDLEGQYKLTIEHIERCLDLYADHIEPYWIALPINLRNAVSVYEPHWTCWDPDVRESWIRRPPKRAITDESAFPFFRRSMEFEDFVPLWCDWYAQDRPLASFVGIRTTESINRWRSIASDTKQRWRGKCWTTRHGPHVVSVYPIYDWRTEDIWTYHARYPDRPHNRLYELMHRAGLTIHQQRICQPYGDDQRKGLWLFHVIEPETWGRLVARVNGANQGALYAQEPGNILGQQKVTRPAGHTWQSFAELLLGSMPKPTSDHYRIKIDIFLRWWYFRGYEGGIPDEADPRLEAQRKVPSWRRICKALLRNDYWCKGLTFSQQPSEAYARYKSNMMRRNVYYWGEDHYDPNGPPTAKQMALIAAMTGGSNPSHALVALGNALGIGKAAAKNATAADASRAIEIIRRTESAKRQEIFGR